ncbi:MAG TPA: DNA-3-methyladenine glycosylase [Ignavibacteriaceae bacterium]|nr:DNA-3-methyladenine glycosylase [Ignavibacteriaceae bacterium]
MRNSYQKLKRSFYTRNVLIVAKELLGKILVKRSGSIILSGKIAEVEAYDGSIDQAAHTFRGMTERNKIMFGIGGFLYVYFTYGNHYCSNVVTGKEGSGTAVLIRAIEPVNGLDLMIKNRFGRDLLNEKEKFNLTSGPGKVCKALGITMEHYGTDLTGNQIYILDSTKLKPEEIGVSKRIGIIKSVDLPWRFYIKDNPYVSKRQ